MTDESDDIPPAVELVADFINTRHVPHATGHGGYDQFINSQALSDWLAAQGLFPPAGPVSEGDLRWAIDVREALRSLLDANAGETPTPETVPTLNRAARGAHLQVAFQPDGRAALEPFASGVDAALGRILAAVASAQADGSWERLKACRNQGCRWAFYDQSKNRSAAWCGSSCGNLMKARAYRRRHGGKAGHEHSL